MSVQPRRTVSTENSLRGYGQEEARVREIFTGFSTWMRDDKGYAATTRRNYLLRCQKAHRWLRTNGHPGLHLATEETIRAFWDSLAPGVDNRICHRSALVAFFKFINKMGWRPDNPAIALPSPRRRARLPRPLPTRETKVLLDMAETMGPMMNAMVNMFCYTGIRNAELRALKWSDIDGPWLRITNGKGGKPRDVPIPPPAMLALVRWRRSTTAAEWVFPSARSDDRPIGESTLANYFLDLSEMCAIHITPHILRHTYATELMSLSGGDLRAVQDALGHSSPSTTALYTRVQPQHLQDVAEAMVYG